MKQSKLFTLNFRDLAKAGIVAFGTALGMALLDVLESGEFPDTLKELYAILRASITVTVVYLLKNFLTKPIPPSASPIAKE